MDTHLNDDVIFQHVSGKATPELNIEIESHIEECDSCFEKLRSLLYLKENFQEIWQAVSLRSMAEIQEQVRSEEAEGETSAAALPRHSFWKEKVSSLRPNKGIRPYLLVAAAILLVLIGNFVLNIFTVDRIYYKWVKSGIVAAGIDMNSPVGTAELDGMLARVAGARISTALPASDRLKVSDGANAVEAAFKLEKEDRSELTKGLAENTPLTYRSALKLIDNFAGEMYSPGSDKPGKYLNLAVNSGGALLKDMEVKGNLYLLQGIGEGEVTLNNVSVAGKVYVLGGGMSSVVLEDTNAAKVVVNKENGKVRVFAKEGTVIDYIALGSGARLQSESSSTAAFRDVRVTSGVPKGSRLQLYGLFPNVVVDAAGIDVEVGSGSVGKLALGRNAAGSTVDIGEKASVDMMKVNAPAEIKGRGVVNTMEINSDGVRVDVKTGNNQSGETGDTARTNQITVTNKTEISTGPSGQAGAGNTGPSSGPAPAGTRNTRPAESAGASQAIGDQQQQATAATESTKISDASKQVDNNVDIGGVKDSNINIGNNNIDNSVDDSNNTTNNVDNSLKITNEVTKNNNTAEGGAAAVSFKDKTLEFQIRRVLGKNTGSLTATDLLGIESLALPYYGIADISGIEYLKNLKKLDLTGNRITDVSPLTSLKNLTALYISKNSITDYSVLKGIYANLQYKDFELSGN